jgi:hypothetical protein
VVGFKHTFVVEVLEMGTGKRTAAVPAMKIERDCLERKVNNPPVLSIDCVSAMMLTTDEMG